MAMPKKISIAFMTHTIDGRKAKGTAVVARKYVEALLQHHDDFDITFVHYEKCDDPIYTHGVREVIMPTLWPKFLNRRWFRQTLYFITTKDHFDIFHWGQPRLYPFFWLAPAKHLVITTHGAESAGVEPFDIMVLLFKWTLIFSKKRIAISIGASSYARDEIIKFYGFEPSKVRAIANGVEPHFKPANEQEVAAVKQAYALPDKFFLNVARLNPGKNSFRVIRAFTRFVQMNPSSTIHFVNVGNDGSEKELVEAYLKDCPAKNRIHLVGFVKDEDLPALYTAADALIFPLINDGFGLPLLEAMACGTPTIASKTAQPEITHDDAILVDPFSEEAIAKAMEELLKNEVLRASLVSHGLAKARLYTWEEVGKKVISIYRELCEAK